MSDQSTSCTRTHCLASTLPNTRPLMCIFGPYWACSPPNNNNYYYYYYFENGERSVAVPMNFSKVISSNQDRKSTRLNSSHQVQSRMPSSA